MRFVRLLILITVVGAIGAGGWWLWIHRTVEPGVVDTVEPQQIDAAFQMEASTPDQTRTNVVLAIVCTFRKDRLEPYGMKLPTSPFLKRLADEGIKLENHIAQAPWTRPSMGSLLTSRWPRALQLDNPGPKGSLELVLREEHLSLIHI